MIDFYYITYDVAIGGTTSCVEWGTDGEKILDKKTNRWYSRMINKTIHSKYPGNIHTNIITIIFLVYGH